MAAAAIATARRPRVPAVIFATLPESGQVTQNFVKWWKHSHSVSCSANAAASERLTAR
jgi:hypothetical protein